MNIEQGTSNNEGAAKVRTSEFPDLLITRKSTRGHEDTKSQREMEVKK